MNSVLLSRAPSWQWQPTRTYHNPHPPLALESPTPVAPVARAHTYLKFNGQRDGISGQFLTFTPAHNFTIVAFFRLLSIPTAGAPIVSTFASDGTLATGIWVTRGSASAYNECAFLAPAGSIGLVDRIGRDVAKNPIRLGRIYRVEFIFDNDTNTFSAGVDGVRVSTTTNFGFGGDDMFIAFGGEDGTGGPNRAMHFELLQAKVEADRDLTYYDGFPVVSANSDPFVDLTVDPTATYRALWLCDEGTGTTLHDTAPGSDGWGPHDLSTVAVSAPDWAAAEDPQLATGQATWDFANVYGYAVRQSDAPGVVHRPVFGPAGPVGDKTSGELGLSLRAPIFWEDGDQTTQWTPSTQLSASSVQVFESRRSLRSDGAVGTSNQAALDAAAFAGTIRTWLRCWFYDPGGTTATRVQRICFFNTGTLTASIGVHIAQSGTQYVTFLNGAGTPHQASGIALSVGWHEFLIFSERPNATNGTIRYYIDSQLVRTEAGTVAYPKLDTLGIREIGVNATNDDGFWDWIHVGQEYAGSSNTEYAQIVESSGSIVLPLLQPVNGVRFFRGVAITEATAGGNSMTTGATTYTFRHSIDGGSSWSGAIALTTANLRARSCVGNGQDVLEITVAQSSALDDIGSPATRQIVVEYEPAVEVVKMDEDADLGLIAQEA